MLLYILQICLTAVAAAVIGGIAIILIATVVYFIAGAITSLIQTYKDVKAKKKADKFLKAINDLCKNMDSANTKSDSR